MRLRDVLTLGLSPSRWNPLYRWWSRRDVQRQVAVALKAVVLRHYPAGQVDLTDREMQAASDSAALSGWDAGGGYRVRVFRDRPPQSSRPVPVRRTREVEELLRG